MQTSPWAPDAGRLNHMQVRHEVCASTGKLHAEVTGVNLLLNHRYLSVWFADAMHAEHIDLGYV